MEEQPTSPKIALDDTYAKSKEIVNAVQGLQKLQEEADRKVNKEIRAHDLTKQKIKNIEADQGQAKQAAETEARTHLLTKEKYQKEDRAHAKTRDALQAAKDDVASMRLQMDAMKVEMDAQRKAFVINVNWAARCTELKTQFDKSCSDYEQLLEKHIKAKAEMDAALRAQEEFRMKNQASLDEYASAREQIARLTAELTERNQVTGDVQKKLAELDEFQAKFAAEETKKKLGSQQALSVLQRSLAKGAEGLKTSAFAGWASLTVTEKKKRLHKDRAMQRAVKLIADEGMALCAETFGDWRREVEDEKRSQLLAAAKRLEEASAGAGAGAMTGRQRAIKQLEKQFAGEAFSLLKSTFQGWALGQIARKKREQNHKKASRMIAGSGAALCAEVFALWNDLTAIRRRKNKTQAANMQKATRMLADNDKVLTTNIFQNWYGMIEEIRRKRKVDEAGTAKAMRMMANSAVALMNLCFDSWSKDHAKNKDSKEGNKKALRMIAGSAQVMLLAVWQVWSKDTKAKKAKGSNMSKAVRMINSSNEAMQAATFQTWATFVAKDKDRNKKIRALEKTFGAEDAGKKMIVFSAWENYSQVEGRRKRAKEFSMRSAVKSITGNQDILKCHIHLVWARFASQDKAEKLAESARTLEAQLTDAVEEARVAVEEDLVKAKAEVERITMELEGKRKACEDTKGTLEGLEARLEETFDGVKEHDKQVTCITSELEQSRRKAKDISEELAKVGIFIHSHPPVRKSSRTGSGGSRPRSGQRTPDDKLPPIGSNSRPPSGSKMDGSKSARGVPGERGHSARREGRPPRNPEDSAERRHLMDGAGPYTYAEFVEIYSDKGSDTALAQWNAGAPEVPTVLDGGYGNEY